MAAVTTIDEDLLSPDFGYDPYPTYRRLLGVDSPVFSAVRGAWLLARFDHVMGAFHDWAHFSSEGRVGAMLDHFGEQEWAKLGALRAYAELRGIIHLDPPEHRRLRTLVIAGFTRRVVDQLRPRIDEIVDELLDAVADQGRMDVVADLALQLPTWVICEMLGIDYADRERFVAWSDAALGLQGAKRPTLDVALAAQDGYVGLQSFFADLVAERRAHPRGTPDRPDLLTELIEAREDGERLTEADLIQTCLTLLMGGYETTTSLIANTVALLLQHPDTEAEVRADPSLVEPLIEEVLRYESPIQTVTRRVAADLHLGDSLLRTDELVITMIGAANRDPRHFADPDAFDIHRQDNKHIAFGYGVHFCLGAPLARIEAPVAIGKLLDRFGPLHLDDGDVINWNAEKVVTRCPKTLPVSFG